MLLISIISLYLSFFLEGIVLILFNCVYSRKKTKGRKIAVCGILLGICIGVVEILPINYGTNQILPFMSYVIICTKLISIEPIAAITNALINYIMFFVCKYMCVFIYAKLFAIDIIEIVEYRFSFFSGIIPTIIFCFVCIIRNKIIKNKIRVRKIANKWN